MNQRAIIALLTLPLATALAACSGNAGNSTANAAGGNAAAPAGNSATASAGGANGGGVRIQPGEWEISITSEGGPSIPAQRVCITPEMADRGAADMVNGGTATTANGMTCDRSGLSMAGGRISGNVTCTGAQGMRSTVQMDGQINTADYDIRQTVNVSVGGQNQTASQHIVGRRTGECTASTPGAPGAGAAAAGNAAAPADAGAGAAAPGGGEGH